ncbi:uncharacterized protein ACWYII_012259 [Salvelinus alpinus]
MEGPGGLQETYRTFFVCLGILGLGGDQGGEDILDLGGNNGRTISRCALVRMVKDKRRSPPSDRPPTAPHANPHHSASPEDQESPERVVQKEKLHAELKQVLSLKRSHLKETSHLAQPEMDSSTEARAVEETASEVVEVVMETEPEAGASGYSVTGGGERGIFIKDVLKDSTAAKHLSLQQASLPCVTSIKCIV